MSTAHEEDGYYGPLLANSPDRDKKVVIDPANNIPCRLFGEEEIRQLFHRWEVVCLEQVEQMGAMHGGHYRRVNLRAQARVPA